MARHRRAHATNARPPARTHARTHARMFACTHNKDAKSALDDDEPAALDVAAQCALCACRVRTMRVSCACSCSGAYTCVVHAWTRECVRVNLDVSVCARACVCERACAHACVRVCAVQDLPLELQPVKLAQSETGTRARARAHACSCAHTRVRACCCFGRRGVCAGAQMEVVLVVLEMVKELWPV